MKAALTLAFHKEAGFLHSAIKKPSTTIDTPNGEVQEQLTCAANLAGWSIQKERYVRVCKYVDRRRMLWRRKREIALRKRSKKTRYQLNKIITVIISTLGTRYDLSLDHWRKRMTKVTIDDKEYETDDLSENAQAQLTSLQFTNAEIQRLQALLAAMQTASNAYGKALQQELDQVWD